MKNSKFIKFSILGLLPSVMALGVFSITPKQKTVIETSAYSVSSLPTTIDLNATSDEEIRNYYSSLSKKSNAEKQGNNLLKNLKPILSNNQKYFSYDTGKNDIWKAYEIIDRDWELSPAQSITNGRYDSKTNTIYDYVYCASQENDDKNPYVHALYVDRNVDNPMKAWGNHTQKYGGINQEHIWPKSHGFDTNGAGGARGDLMHLWAADGYSNNMHNNFAYGYVDPTKIEKRTVDKISYATGNIFGISLTLGSEKVFEPQDSDKGDVARALFYMAARYNNFAGATTGIDSNDPNLILDNYAVREAGTSTATKPMKYGVLSDLLEWNKLDPVDDFEIRRNNILFKNFTNNRNPFIDFPEWADLIWGDYGDSDYAKPDKDKINGDKQVEKDAPVSIEITTKPNKLTYFSGEKFLPAGMIVTATYADDSKETIKDYSYTSSPLINLGENTIYVSYKNLNAEVKVTVIEKTHFENGTYTFSITADDFSGNNYANNNGEKQSKVNEVDKNVYWSSFNVAKSGGMQWQKSGGYICNTLPLDNITNISLELNDGAYGEFEIYYGHSFKPEFNTQPGGRFFAIYNKTGKTSHLKSINITFKIDNQPLIDSISVSGDYETTFRCKDDFNSTGLVVTQHLEDGSSSEVDMSKVIVSAPSMDVPGNEDVIVSYTSNRNEIFETSYEIEITNYVVSLEFENADGKEFDYGSTFNHRGVKVYALMADDELVDVTSKVSYSSPNMNELGEQEITVTYIEEGVEITGKYTIFVVDYLVSISVSGDYYTEYELGTSFDPDGIIITGSYAGPTPDEVIPTNKVKFSKLDTSKLGEQEITVTYKGLTTSFTITVVEPGLSLLGCFGSAATTSIIVSAFSIFGLLLVLLKRKEN